MAVYDELAPFTQRQYDFLKERTVNPSQFRSNVFAQAPINGLNVPVPVVPVQEPVRAWVKIPTLHPDSPNALMHLTLADLDTLISRANSAKRKIEEQEKLREQQAEYERRQAEARVTKPGARVRHRAGKTGTVLSRKLGEAMLNPARCSPTRIAPTSVFVLFDGEASVSWACPSLLTLL